ncbi:MAG: MraY family glycosyltransferase [Kiritimatiellae bacterium]|nr:MraY family glycosyltransferase [Kiritimatiellia bacterium]
MNSGLEFLVSLSAVLWLTPQTRRLARLCGCMDRPSSRKVHAVPTPLLGGAAIALAVLCGWLAAAMVMPRTGLLQHPLPLVMGMAMAMMLVGLLDDCLNLSWSLKLVAQLVAAGLLYAGGVKVQLAWLPDWVNLSLTLLWLVGITNAINFLDNMNGLAAGLCAISASFFTLLGLLHHVGAVTGVAAAVAGASLGFLRFNYRNASIFMGDAGSLLLGMLLATTGVLLRFPGKANWITWMTPVMVMLVPVFDMTLVCLSRLRHGRNPLATPGQDHISHRLVRLGLTHAQAVDTVYGLAVVCGAAGALSASLPGLPAYVMCGLLSAAFVAGLVFLTIKAPASYPPRDNHAP